MQRTSENRGTANELVEDIHDLVKVIEETVKAVRNNIKLMEEFLGKGRDNSLKLDQCRTPVLFDEMISGLVKCALVVCVESRGTNDCVNRDLECISAVIVEEQKHGFFSSLLRNSEIESNLEDAKRKVENSMKNFQVLTSKYSWLYMLLICTTR
jgi:hypothetical protein